MRLLLLSLLTIMACNSPKAHAHNHNGDSENKVKAPYSIEELKPGIYRTQQGPYYGIVLVGDSGLLIFDTFSKEFSQWLDTEIQSRFPNKPVKYVVYSHNHPDHISGGQVFAHHNPVYISHELAKNSMERMKVATHYPSVTFDQSLQIDLDGNKIEFNYWGQNDGWGSISMYVPEQKFIAAIDWALTDRVPYMEIRRYNVDGIIRSLYEIDKLDWYLISPGHASTGTKAQVRNFRSYVETIRDGVVSGINAGHNEEQIVQDILGDLKTNANFTSLKMFDKWSEQNVRGIYRQIAEVEGILE